MVEIKNLLELSLAWGNPYTEPPSDIETLSGQLRTRWAFTLLDRAFESEAWRQADDHKPGDGWVRRIDFVNTQPPRRWSPEAKGRVRRGNLRKRLDAHVPLFAQQIFDAELMSRPDYFFPTEVRR